MNQEITPPTEYRAGFVAIAGKPNVGKSTLLNALLGQKIAAVTYRPQTTRKQQLGILTLENAQIIFMDTPGIHHPQHKLGERMNAEATTAFEDASLLLILVDVSQPPEAEDELLAGTIQRVGARLPGIVALNKTDRIDAETLATRTQEFAQLFPGRPLLPISALRKENLAQLIAALLERLPFNAPFFPEEQLTDLYEREIAADLIREAALLLLRDEIPHGIAVRVDEFTERGETGAYIAATIFVERESQIAIVVGKGGSMLKRLGTHARQQIEEMSGRKVHLQLHAKVRKNWRNDDATLHNFGFTKTK